MTMHAKLTNVCPLLALRVVAMRADGHSFRAIARRLQALHLASPTGTPWHSSTVRAVYYSTDTTKAA